jgi:hypothetical protein
MAIPTSSLPVILAVQYQTAEQEMASTLFFSTIFSVHIVPLEGQLSRLQTRAMSIGATNGDPRVHWFRW